MAVINLAFDDEKNFFTMYFAPSSFRRSAGNIVFLIVDYWVCPNFSILTPDWFFTLCLISMTRSPRLPAGKQLGLPAVRLLLGPPSP
jgi:hypothetical protein